MKESKMLSGVLITLLTLTLLNNGLNAAHATKNNLLSERALTTTLTPPGVFLVILLFVFYDAISVISKELLCFLFFICPAVITLTLIVFI